MVVPYSAIVALVVDGLNAEAKLRFRERELFLMPGISKPNFSPGADENESG
jgi:hypothetical protein